MKIKLLSILALLAVQQFHAAEFGSQATAAQQESISQELKLLQDRFDAIRDEIHKKLGILSNLLADQQVTPEIKKELSKIGKELNNLNINGVNNSRVNQVNNLLPKDLESANTQLEDIQNRISTIKKDLNIIEIALDTFIMHESEKIERKIPADIRQRAQKVYEQRT
jgi:hypothetical protein